MRSYHHLSRMLPHHSLAILLWRLRRESGLYLFGAGASAPFVPLTPALLLDTAQSYVSLGSIPIETAPQTVLTKRVLAQANHFDLWGRPLRPGTDEFPTLEILARLPHGGALAYYIHRLAEPRFARLRIPNYTVLRPFPSSLMYTWNMDGLAEYACGDRHHVISAHGSVAAGYGSIEGAVLARQAQEYALEIVDHGLHPIGPECIDDLNLQRKLLPMQQCTPAFVLIVGYSFGLFEGRCDDQLALSTFLARFRNVPIDVYVCDPRPYELAEMLRAELRSDRVHAFPVYWNVLAWAFIQTMAGRIDVADLNYVHEMTLDAYGASFQP